MPGKASKSGSKKKAPSAPKVKSNKNRNEYVELSKASAVDNKPQSFYAVVTDATFAYKTPHNKYVCSLKITDGSVGSGKNSYAQLVIYARTFEELPIISRIGDVIRVHRSILRLHNGVRQFNASVQYNSSWALFSSDKKTPNGDDAKEFEPFAHSGKSYSFEKHERDTLSKVRKFAQTHFASNNVLGNDWHVALAKADKQKGDFDVLAKVLHVFDRDEYTNELRIKDGSNQVWYVNALKLKFPHVSVGDVVRIRSAIYDETAKKRVLNLSHYSNIMTFISHSKLAKDVRGKVSDDKSADKAALKNGNDVHPVMVTEVDKKHANLPVTSVKDLFSNSDDVANNTTFRTQFMVSKIEPGNVQEFVKSYDKKANKTSSTKGGKGGNHIYQVQFLVRGGSSSSNTYRVLLYSHEGHGKEFFGASGPQDLHKNGAAAKKIEEQAGHLTRFNSWVDAVVERKNGYYFIKDTKMAF